MTNNEEINTLKHYIKRINTRLEGYEELRSKAIDRKTFLVEQLRILQEEVDRQQKIKHIQSF